MRLGLALIGSASAADIGYRLTHAAKSPPSCWSLVPFSWTGCYLGGFAGGAWANDARLTIDPGPAISIGVPFDTWATASRVASSVAAPPDATGSRSVPLWVLGIEGEAGYMSLKGSAFDPISFPFWS